MHIPKIHRRPGEPVHFTAIAAGETPTGEPLWSVFLEQGDRRSLLSCKESWDSLTRAVAGIADRTDLLRVIVGGTLLRELTGEQLRQEVFRRMDQG